MMKKLMVAVLIAGTLAATAQDVPSTSFEDINIKRAGKLIGNFKTGNFVERLEGGVDLTIISADPADNLDIQADSIDFDYTGSEESTPTKLTLTGNVVIVNPTMKLMAPKAVLNTKTNIAEFIGDTDIYAEGKSPVRASTVVVNMETGEINMTKVRSIKAE